MAKALHSLAHPCLALSIALTTAFVSFPHSYNSISGTEFVTIPAPACARVVLPSIRSVRTGCFADQATR